MLRSFVGPAGVTAVLVAMTASTFADVLVTTRGREYDGTVTRDNKGNYIVKSAGGSTLSFPEDAVREVIRSPRKKSAAKTPAGNGAAKQATNKPTVSAPAPPAKVEGPDELRLRLKRARDRALLLQQEIVKVDGDLAAAESDARHWQDVAQNGLPMAGGGRMVNLNMQGHQQKEAKRALTRVRTLTARRRSLMNSMSVAVRDALTSGAALAQADPAFALTLTDTERAFVQQRVAEAQDAYHGEETGKPDMARAFKLFSEAADLGSAEAAFSVGIMYLQGDGRKADPTLAAAWFRKAAGWGHPQAMKNLADIVRGNDPAAAVALYEQSGAAGNFGALIALAKMQAAGDGIPADAAAAQRSFRRAALCALTLVQADLQGAVEQAAADEGRDAVQAYRTLSGATRALLGSHDTLMRNVELPEVDRAGLGSFRFYIESLSLSAELAAESEILRRKATLNNDVRMMSFASNQSRTATDDCVKRFGEFNRDLQGLRERWAAPAVAANPRRAPLGIPDPTREAAPPEAGDLPLDPTAVPPTGGTADVPPADATALEARRPADDAPATDALAPAAPAPAAAPALAAPGFAEVRVNAKWMPMRPDTKMYDPVDRDDAGRVWGALPAALENCEFTQVSMHHRDDESRLTFTVERPGTVIMAVHGFGGGGGGGPWQQECVSAEELVRQGWKQLPYQAADKVFFTRACKAGETFTYRTQKYHPPLLIRKVS